MNFFAICNSGRIAIQWFHIKHYLDYQYTKFHPYTYRGQKMCFCMIRDFGSPTITHISKRQSDFGLSRGLYFHETSHMRSFAKIKPSRKFPNFTVMKSKAMDETYHNSPIKRNNVKMKLRSPKNEFFELIRQ